MSYFDELVARYKNMQYGGLSARNPSAIDNVLRTQQGLLGNSLQFGNANQTFMENIPTDEQQFIDTPTGRVAQNRFRMGPDGNPIFGVPGQLDTDGSAGGGAAFYDSSIDYGDPGYAGVIPADPDTGLVGTTTQERERGGGKDGFRFGKPIPDPVYNPNLLGYYVGYNNPKYAPSPLDDANTISDYYSREQRNVDLENRDETNPTTYGYTGPVAKTGLLGLLGNIGKEGLKGKGTKETTEAAAKAAAKTEKEITDAVTKARKEKNKGSKNKGPGAGGTVDKGGKSKGSGGFGGSGDGAGGACFDPNTYIKMQDGSEKKIKDVQLGDLTKGGKVTGVLQFEPIDDIHEYKGVIVAGSHFVKEGNEFIMVQDSLESIKVDKIPVVYSLDTSNRRIFINDIEFADYNGDGIAKNFLNNAGIDLSGFDKEVLRQVEHRLI